ncbi:MAG: hypothetical protein EON95_13635 [Caulobacteraceae bacterium]|nr:MAG: hypothetical protein EON95_13635 [Caulobacteraceae bacterium]
MALTFIRARRPDTAFTAIVTFLAARAPFDRMPLGPVIATVSGAIQRGHYALAVEDGREVVGLTCWALTDYDTALAWSRGEAQPSFDQTLNGDTVMMMMGGGDGPAIALGGLRHIGDRYPGQRYVMNRFDRKRPSLGRFPPARDGMVMASDETAFGE